MSKQLRLDIHSEIIIDNFAGGGGAGRLEPWRYAYLPKESSMTTWTPTTDRLPDDDQCVLIAMEDGEVWTGFHADDRWFYVSADPVGSPVTHWMDFPEAPK